MTHKWIDELKELGKDLRHSATLHESAIANSHKQLRGADRGHQYYIAYRTRRMKTENKWADAVQWAIEELSG